MSTVYCTKAQIRGRDSYYDNVLDATLDSYISIAKTRMDVIMGATDWFGSTSAHSWREDGSGVYIQPIMDLKRPIITLTSITDDNSNTYTVSDMYYDQKSHALINKEGDVFISGIKNIVITATVGWSSVPIDVQEAAIAVTCAMAQDEQLRRGDTMGMIDRILSDDALINYGNGQSLLTTGVPWVGSLLIQYKKVFALSIRAV